MLEPQLKNINIWHNYAMINLNKELEWHKHINSKNYYETNYEERNNKISVLLI